MQALRAGATAEQVHQATKIDPWFVDQLVLILEIATLIKSAPELTAQALLHGASGTASPTLRSRALRHLSEDVVRGVALGTGGSAGLQDRRHLRRGVRRSHSLPLQLLRPRNRGRPPRQAGCVDLGQRSEPDRSGHRVRLLLRTRGDVALRQPATRRSW